MSDLVQAIAVIKGGSHQDTVAAVAKASVSAYHYQSLHPNWKLWLDGRFTKSVRRGSKSQVAKVADSAASGEIKVGDSIAYGFIPMPYQDYPVELSKLQVSNYEERETGDWLQDEVVTQIGGPIVYINEDLEMTTGKTAAQVAHGVFAWYLNAEAQRIGSWIYAGRPLWLQPVSSSDLNLLSLNIKNISIHDAGFTEIKPGSLTVVVAHSF